MVIRGLGDIPTDVQDRFNSVVHKLFNPNKVIQLHEIVSINKDLRARILDINICSELLGAAKN